MFPTDQFILAEDAYRRDRARQTWRAVRRHGRHRRGPGGRRR